MCNRISDMLTRYERGEIRRRDLISGLAALTIASRGAAAPTSSISTIGPSRLLIMSTTSRSSCGSDFFSVLVFRCLGV